MQIGCKQQKYVFFILDMLSRGCKMKLGIRTNAELTKRKIMNIVDIVYNALTEAVLAESASARELGENRVKQIRE